MRARDAIDLREGDNYRYQRALRKDAEDREKRARIAKWDKIYDSILPKKHSDSDEKP